jgi:hypothetical protein
MGAFKRWRGVDLAMYPSLRAFWSRLPKQLIGLVVKVLVVRRVGKLFFDHRYDRAVIKVSNDMAAPALRAFHLPMERIVYRDWTPLPACVLILPFPPFVVEIGKAKGFINGRPTRVPDVLWFETGRSNNVD